MTYEAGSLLKVARTTTRSQDSVTRFISTLKARYSEENIEPCVKGYPLFSALHILILTL